MRNECPPSIFQYTLKLQKAITEDFDWKLERKLKFSDLCTMIFKNWCALK